MIGRKDPPRDAQTTEEVRVPLVEEELQVGRREVETGHVRVRTIVDEEKVALSELLERDVVDIERVPVGVEVQTAPLPFEEDGVLIIPVIEERLVVEKRLFVVEEIRVHRRHIREKVDVPATRRVMRAEIERAGNSDTGSTRGTTSNGK